MKPTIIPKVRHHHPGKRGAFARFLKYLQTRPGVMERSDGTWIDRGLGADSTQIADTCEQLKCRRVLGRNFSVAPDPELLMHLPPADRPGVISRTIEAGVETWYASKDWGTPEYSYVLHDKEKNGRSMMHGHVITAGTIQPDAAMRRRAHFVNKTDVYDLHDCVGRAFEQEFERVLGRERAQAILAERAERIARERRERWLARCAARRGTPRRRPRLDTSKLYRVRLLLSLIRRSKGKKKTRQRSRDLHLFLRLQQDKAKYLSPIPSPPQPQRGREFDWDIEFP